MRTPPPAVAAREPACCQTPPPKLALPAAMEIAKPPKSQPEPELSMDELWQMADACRAEYMPELSSSKASTECDSDDEEGVAARSTVGACVSCRLPCGTLHVCGRGHHCPYAEPNEDRELVCKYTGVVVGREATDEFFDLNGGTGKRSGDPDRCCGEPQYGKWQRRADPLAISRMAYEGADEVDSDDEAEAWEAEAARMAHEATGGGAAAIQPVTARSSGNKRGARCVGDDASELEAGRIAQQAQPAQQEECEQPRHALHAALGSRAGAGQARQLRPHPQLQEEGQRHPR